MNRLIEKIVFVGFVTAWRFAGIPTRRSFQSLNATTEGVILLPSALAMTTGSLPSITATTEFVVPRSIPMILSFFVEAIGFSFPSRNLFPSLWLLSTAGLLQQKQKAYQRPRGQTRAIRYY